MLRLGVLAGLVLLVSSCAELGTDDELTGCPGGTATPTATTAVVDALRSEGIGAYDYEDGCDGGAADQVATVTNVVDTGPHETDSDYDEIVADEGFVLCGIRRKAFRAHEVDVRPDVPAEYAGDKTEVWLANVECTIYPEGDDKAGQIARLRRALEKLEATL
jgi:hypothetical protein